MKNLIGTICIVLGILLGLYLGLWVLFIGGIFGIAKAIDSHTVTATLIAINVVKIILAGFVGWLTVYIGVILGGIIMSK